MNQTKVDVGFGLPDYMKTYWESRYDTSPLWTEINMHEHLSYNYGKPLPKLIESIVDIHDRVGNAETSGYHIVVGNGASQVVSAIAYAMIKRGCSEILLRPPYWGRLAKLLTAGANFAGATGSIIKSTQRGLSVSDNEYFEFVTSPNNPNGTLHPEESKIVDMCYNWPQYTDRVRKGAHDVMIFGLSKATGHAGTRIGWALVKDQSIADSMSEYIEISTCGTSSDAQDRASCILDWCDNPVIPEIMSCFDFASLELFRRWSRFRSTVSRCEEIQILNDRGMFAWCQYKDTSDVALTMRQQYGIEVTGGKAFGLEDECGHFRINMGCSEDTFNRMIEALSHGQLES